MKKALIVLVFVATILGLLGFSGCGKQSLIPDSPHEQYEEAAAKTIPDARILTEAPRAPDTKARYLFYLHGRIIEDQGAENAVSPEFGRYEYAEILDTFADRGFVVISEARPKNTNVTAYAQKIAEQINALLKGVPAANITVAGASKGGAITHKISSILHNKDLNFVLLAGCGEGYHEGFDIDLAGNVLSVYDYKDDKGAGSCADFFAKSKDINHHKEIELKLGTGHGILYKPLDEWVEPTVQWASGNYK
ncbi:MAG TPA: hypothetical protein VGO50_08895 [Pyrinomonadaceae bacterium]|jgi:hypothetical protein|nr:hypothetical protein [Pyrinomonadaceae bacterium]